LDIAVGGWRQHLSLSQDCWGAEFVIIQDCWGDLSSSQDCIVGGKEFVIVAGLLGWRGGKTCRRGITDD